MTADNINAPNLQKLDIPIEAVATYPFPGTAVPGALSFSPDDKLITYLFSAEGSLSRQLYAFDPETGRQNQLVVPPGEGETEENLPAEEKLRRERMRQMALGVTQYAWANKSNRLLVPLKGEFYVQDGLDAPLRKIVSSDGPPALDPHFSPDGRWVAYVQDDELYVVSARGGDPQQLTHGARGTGKTHGLAEYIAQEEMDRYRGYWWSADSQWLAFTEVDETHIPLYRIIHQGKDTVGAEAQEEHRYPFAGQPNAQVKLGVVSVDGGEPAWMDLGQNEDIYLARVKWLPNGRLVAQILNREQTQLDLLAFDPQTGQSQLLVRETTDVWINLHNLFRPLKDGRFLWASERTGFQHLYLYDEDGGLIRPLTQGDWMVEAIAAVDQKQEIVYFTGARSGPTERHLYAVPFAGDDVRQITAVPGIHTVTIDHRKQRFTDTHHALDKPPTITLRCLADGTPLCPIYDKPDPRLESLALTPPELVTLSNRDGTTLHGAIYRPSAGDAPYPTLVYVYGGPHAQMVTNGWNMTVSMRAQYLCSLGYLVFVLDNRGSARRGLAFEGHVKQNMGHPEVDDQVDGVNWLVEQGLTDPDRVGIYGWSYGGYMALICLARAADTFKVAVAGAPVTHWDGYDTCYTERYMGTPQSHPEEYESSSVMPHVGKIRGKLMLVHGLIDENVHFRHTARLINALIHARIPYDLLLFPDERHSPRQLADRVFMEERIRDHFRQHL